MKKLGLIFAGGGARSVFFLGFYRGLLNHGITVDHIHGYSGGSLMIGGLASGYSDEEFLERLMKFKVWKTVALNPLANRGLVSIEKYEKKVNDLIGDVTFENLPISATISVTDVTDPYNPQNVVIEEGKLSKYITMSSIIPPMFPLYKDNGRSYVDGGFSTMYNRKALEERGVEKVIGLTGGSIFTMSWPPIVEELVILWRSQMTLREVYEVKDYSADMVFDMEIKDSEKGFKNAKVYYDYGLKMAEENIEKIKELLEA